jgi:hypothetical protein
MLRKMIVLAVVVGISCVVWKLARSERLTTETPASQIPGSELIVGYQQWTRVNPKPAVLPSQIAIQCARPTFQQQEIEENNPHRDKFVVVYVNDIGKDAMMKEKKPKFPEGSIIVKEKYPAVDHVAPELLTVMRKREAGYNQKNGDWEYMVFDGAATKVLVRGKLEPCQGCHLMHEQTDFVSRNYLPDEIWKKLK